MNGLVVRVLKHNRIERRADTNDHTAGHTCLAVCSQEYALQVIYNNMKRIINEYEFSDSFHRMGRGSQFSYEGLRALFEYLENYEQETETEMELDVIALCSEFTEYENLKELQENYTDIESMEDIASLA
jgi:hypothetical protein